MRHRRRHLAVLVVALLTALAGTVLPVQPAGAGTQATTNACLSNATATFSDIDITMSGTAAPDPVPLGDPVTLSAASFQASVPANLLVSGYNLGLLTLGVNNIPVSWWVARTASNTVEGQDNQSGSVAVQTTITDPDGVPGSGDEGATPLNVSVPLADRTFTPTGGTVELRQGGSIPQIPAGQAGPGAVTPAGSVFFSASVAGGLIRANFDCRPGLTDEDGADNVLGTADDAKTFTSTAPATPFDTVAVTASATAPSCTDETVSVAVDQTVAIDLTDNCTDVNGDLDLSTLVATTSPSAGTLTPTGDGTFDFAAPADAGDLTFDFTVEDTGGLVSSAATVTITVVPPSAPVCEDEAVSGEPDEEILIDLSDNCTDADGDLDLSTLAFSSGSPPSPGDDPGTFTFTAPEPGTEVFTFTVEDELGQESEPATLTITIAAAPPPTTAPPSTTTTTAPASEVPLPVSGTASYATSCTNSVTPDISELLFEVTGTTMSPIQAGSATSLTGQSWRVTVPASVLQTGINLGLLNPGDIVSGSVTVAVFASNTQQGTVTAAPVAIAVGPIAVDGAGSVLPAVVTFAVPDMTWTAVGGNVSFTMASASVEVSIGPLKVTFACEPKAPAPAIVTAVVRGQTGIQPAVLGAAQNRQSLPRTGIEAIVPVAFAVALLDLGYLALSATWTARRRRAGAAT